MSNALQFKKLNRLASIPRYAHEGDSGLDISSCEDAVILPHAYRKVSTGVACVIPDGYELQVRPRSGLQAKYGIVAGFGTVDNGYRGEIGVVLFNNNDEPYYVRVGDRIAQLVPMRVERFDIEEVSDIPSDTERSTSGFGSTSISIIVPTANEAADGDESEAAQ